MAATNDFAKIYDTVLSTPGMSDNVKIDLRIPRRNVYLLVKVIERGLSEKPEDFSHGVLSLLNGEKQSEFQNISDDLLKKAGLTDMNEKLKALR